MFAHAGSARGRSRSPGSPRGRTQRDARDDLSVTVVDIACRGEAETDTRAAREQGPCSIDSPPRVSTVGSWRPYRVECISSDRSSPLLFAVALTFASARGPRRRPVRRVLLRQTVVTTVLTIVVATATGTGRLRGTTSRLVHLPFDARQRSPEDGRRCSTLGIRKFAYDWRAEPCHAGARDRGAEAARVELTAFWFPAALKTKQSSSWRRSKAQAHAALWVSAGANDVDGAANVIRPIATEAARIGCTVGLYTMAGGRRAGEPARGHRNLAMPNVGIVYNQHHATITSIGSTRCSPKVSRTCCASTSTA